jgi:hypothetical protein
MSLLMSAPRKMQMPLTGDYDEKGSSQNELTALTATSVSPVDVKL